MPKVMRASKRLRDTLPLKDGRYVPHFALETEGGRVGLSMCARCGCAILMCDDRDPFALHDKWHEDQARVARPTVLEPSCRPLRLR